MTPHIENPGRKVEKEKVSESWWVYRTSQLAAASEFLRANHLDLGLQGLQSFSISGEENIKKTAFFKFQRKEWLSKRSSTKQRTLWVRRSTRPWLMTSWRRFMDFTSRWRRAILKNLIYRTTGNGGWCQHRKARDAGSQVRSHSSSNHLGHENDIMTWNGPNLVVVTTSSNVDK